MSVTTGYREAERASQIGLLYDPEKALTVRLVDEIYDADEGELMCKAQEEINKWLKIPG